MFRLVCVLALSVFASTAASDAVFRFTQEGGDVVGRLSGVLNVSGVSATQAKFAGCNACSFHSGSGAVLAAEDMSVVFDRYLITGPAFFKAGLSGPSGDVVMLADTSYSGDPFAMVGFQNYLYLPQGYTEANGLSGTLRLQNQSFASLGVDPGIYEYTISTQNLDIDTVAVVFDGFVTTSIPLPAGAVLLVSALGAVAICRRKQTPRQAQS